MRRSLSLAACVSLLIVLSPTRSLAVDSAQSGWWTSAPVAAPDVPADGLLLQGGPTLDRPVAFGAVRFALGADEQPGDLTLAVAANSGTTPSASLTVCPLTKAFTTAQGGAMADAPTFDCTKKATATRSSDGQTFTVHAGAFAGSGAVALALLPSAVTDRIVFDKPDTASLSTSRVSVASNAATPAPRGVAASGPSTAPSFVPSGGTAAAPASPTSGTAAAASSAPPPAAPVAPARIDVPVAARKHAPTPVIAFVALVVLMSALWLFAGNTSAVSASMGGPQS